MKRSLFTRNIGILLVAMLIFFGLPGTAFAADPTINLESTNVTVMADESPLTPDIDLSIDEPTVIFEEVTLDELYTDTELFEFIMENGGFEPIEQAQEELMVSIHESLASNVRQATGDISITAQQIAMIIDKYDLQPNSAAYPGISTQAIVKRDINTRAVSAVWYLTYHPNQTNFKVNITVVGDPIDEIDGIVDVYRLNGTSWGWAGQGGFGQYQVRSGTVYTWDIAVDYVKEKFNYRITIKDNGGTWSYNNTGEDNIYRYNFAAGSYSSMAAKGGQRHHFISSSALGYGGYNTNAAYAIRMITTDHYLTGSYGSSQWVQNEKNLIAQGKYVELINMNIDDFRRKADPDSSWFTLYDKYYYEIVVCVVYYSGLFGV